MNVSPGSFVHAAPSIQPAQQEKSAIDVRPIDVTVRGTLQLESPGPDGATFVSAASGLVGAGGVGWAISDNLPQLIRVPGQGVPVTLTHGLPAREKRYDLESITAVPDAHGGTTLLAFGSGSKAKRGVGFLQAVDGTGQLVGASRPVDLTSLYATLGTKVPLELNIEGAAIRQGASGAELVLLHRGKADGDVNQAFVLDADQVVAAAREGRPVPATSLLASTPIELGTIDGQQLGFSDARALPDGRIVFVASSEGSDAVGNGAIGRSAFGILDANLNVTTLRPMTGPARKVEGIEQARAFDPTAPEDRFLLVTDADDPTRASELLSIDV